MKPALPPPTRQDGTPFPTLDSLVRTVVSVPKADIDKEEENWKRERKRKPAKAKRPA